MWEFSRFLSSFLLFPCVCVFLILNSRVDYACTQREKVFGYSLSTNSSRALIGREMSLGRSAELSQKAELVIRRKSPCEVTDAGSSQVFPIHCLLHVRHLLLVRLHSEDLKIRLGRNFGWKFWDKTLKKKVEETNFVMNFLFEVN